MQYMPPFVRRAAAMPFCSLLAARGAARRAAAACAQRVVVRGAARRFMSFASKGA